MPTPAFGPVTSEPPMRTAPAVARSRPATIRKSVLLPQPLGPSSEMNFPSGISRLTCCRASMRAPLTARKVLLTFWIEISAGACPVMGGFAIFSPNTASSATIAGAAILSLLGLEAGSLLFDLALIPIVDLVDQAPVKGIGIRHELLDLARVDQEFLIGLEVLLPDITPLLALLPLHEHGLEAGIELGETGRHGIPDSAARPCLRVGLPMQADGALRIGAREGSRLGDAASDCDGGRRIALDRIAAGRHDKTAAEGVVVGRVKERQILVQDRLHAAHDAVIDSDPVHHATGEAIGHRGRRARKRQQLHAVGVDPR